MPILVTGATGLVGNNVVRLLLEQGRKVRALTRAIPSKRPLEGLDVEIVHGDVDDIDSLERACEGVDLVIHAAGYVRVGWTNQAEHRRVNTDGTRHVAQAAKRVGARMVFVSTVNTINNGSDEGLADEETPHLWEVNCPYVTSKAEAERLIIQMVGNGFNATIVNPTYMLGPWDWKPSSGKMILEVASGTGVLAPPGGNTFCDVRDVAAGILKAAEHGQPGRRYILGGHPLSYIEAWEIISSITGGRAPRGKLGPLLLTLVGLGGNLWGRIAQEPDFNSAAMTFAKLPMNFSSRRAEEELGYKIRPFEETVQDAWDWFCENGYVRRRAASGGVGGA